MSHELKEIPTRKSYMCVGILCLFNVYFIHDVNMGLIYYLGIKSCHETCIYVYIDITIFMCQWNYYLLLREPRNTRPNISVWHVYLCIQRLMLYHCSQIISFYFAFWCFQCGSCRSNCSPVHPLKDGKLIQLMYIAYQNSPNDNLRPEANARYTNRRL